MFFPQDSNARLPNLYQVPMPSLGAPTTAPQVEPLSGGKGTNAEPKDFMGATGVGPENPLLPKQFASPTDPRGYPPEGFNRPRPGPGTMVKDEAPFKYAKMGQTTTATPGFPNLSKSGTGLRDQSERYHPQAGTAPSLNGKKRFFK